MFSICVVYHDRRGCVNGSQRHSVGSYVEGDTTFGALQEHFEPEVYHTERDVSMGRKVSRAQE